MSLKRIFVTGGAGYVGSVLVPKLLAEDYEVTVLDLFWYGDSLKSVSSDKRLKQIRGDIRDRALLEKSIPGHDAVIHLACVSNDPSFELNPDLGKSINYDAFIDLVDVSINSGIKRFIYASSSSVYGVKEEENVTETLSLEPLTDYSKYKALCEEHLDKRSTKGFTTLTIRPATVCGYSPRLRLDLTVNILTAHAVANRLIKVFGGEQKRPNIHIADMTDLYVQSLKWPAELIDGKVYNAGYDNLTVLEIAKMVQEMTGPDVKIERSPTDDIRSYHISSEKIKRELGFSPKHSVTDAISDLISAFNTGLIPNPMTDERYYNIRTMKKVEL